MVIYPKPLIKMVIDSKKLADEKLRAEAFLIKKNALAALEKKEMEAGIQKAYNYTVDNPIKAKAIFNNDGVANTSIKAQRRLESRIGPIDTEDEINLFRREMSFR